MKYKTLKTILNKNSRHEAYYERAKNPKAVLNSSKEAKGWFRVSSSMFHGERSERGFTIVETLVAMAVFLITIGVTVGSLTFSLKAQRVVFAEKQVSESVNFAIEFMSRQLRVAQRDLTGACIAEDKIFETAGSEITFLNADSICVRFALNATTGEIEYIQDPGGASEEIVNITNSESVEITMLDFSTLGEPSSDTIQARVSLAMHAEGSGPSPEEQAVNFDIQTTVTSRRLDTL